MINCGKLGNVADAFTTTYIIILPIYTTINIPYYKYPHSVTLHRANMWTQLQREEV